MNLMRQFCENYNTPPTKFPEPPIRPYSLIFLTVYHLAFLRRFVRALVIILSLLVCVTVQHSYVCLSRNPFGETSDVEAIITHDSAKVQCKMHSCPVAATFNASSVHLVFNGKIKISIKLQDLKEQPSIMYRRLRVKCKRNVYVVTGQTTHGSAARESKIVYR
ncbi:uncharacterized protein LOC112692106 [Sipha flava]|uniref:Uncharacterized protein LOC112692106 n=1 Tax=Sipha flava TaxID=143950 RepID=A0A8B8GHH3_9HEMI|nr:uncharacterized protein LOC112692106 [Sipha flava]